jgi:hypothetical protein
MARFAKQNYEFVEIENNYGLALSVFRETARSLHQTIVNLKGLF